MRFWVRGRIAWPLIVAIIFLTISILVGDFSWRIVVMPFDSFLVYAAATDFALAVILAGCYVGLRRTQR